MMLAACASTSPEGEARTRRGNSELITREELAESRSTNLYEYIQMHRPAWLRTRGSTSITQEGTIGVYLDNVRFGGPESLRQLAVDTAERVRFLSATRAQQEFGHDNPHGAIQVISRQSH